MNAPPRLSIVVPVEHSAANLPAMLQRLAGAPPGEVEIILCHAADHPDDRTEVESVPAARWLACAPGSRIPDMWRDGILVAHGEYVALLTAHCVPSERWLAALRSLDLPSGVAAIGGYFVNAADASALDWAIYLLRYAPFSRPAALRVADNVAADNAVYRRDAILACEDLLPRGFWELEYHRRFAARGLRLLLSPDLPVEHRNRYSAAEFAEQRRVHGFHFGRDRARRLGRLGRLAYFLASPAIPVVLLAKVIARARRYGWLGHVRPAVLFSLAAMCVNWGLGEARGVLDSLTARTRA